MQQRFFVTKSVKKSVALSVSEETAKMLFPLWEKKESPYKFTRPLPDIESMLLNSWSKMAFANIFRGAKYVGELTELRTKVDDLSSRFDSLEREVLSCKECINELYSEFTERPIVKETRLFDIDEDLEVLEPIPIVIEESDDEVIASFPEAEVFGVGSGESEAINNLKKEVSKLYYELIDTPDEQLGKVPQSWKRVLSKVVRRVGKTKRI